MTEPAHNLEPNRADMARHLTFLFGDAREYDDGLIEIAVCKLPGKSWEAQIFATDEINAAVEYASKANAAGHNIYVGAALRDPDTPPVGRCSINDYYATTAAYADLDTLEAATAAPERTRKCPPDLVVTTGKHPHPRLQLWWKLAEPISDPELHRTVMGGLIDCLDGDNQVFNPGRVMRLAGSVAWPMKPGRIPEMTSVMSVKDRTHTLDEVAGAYPRTNKVHVINNADKNDPIHRIGKTNSLGLDTGVIDDGRETYMRNTIMAVLVEMIGTTGSVPDAQELFDAAWPQYAAHVDLSRPGRGADEMQRKIHSTLRRFERGHLRDKRGLVINMDTAVAEYAAKQAAREAHAMQVIGITQPQRNATEPDVIAHAPLDAEPVSLVLNAKGNPVWCMANALFTLRNHDDWRDVLAYNDFTGRSILLKPIPGTSAFNSTFPRDIRDSDYTATTVWFNHNGFATASKQAAADALEMAAQDAVMHPVRNYLTSLVWDGKPRLKTWLQVYCGAQVTSQDHAVYVQEAGFRWAISAVARIFRPGCKADAAIILEGRQGCGKSRGLKALAGDAFFGDSLPPMTTKDASTYLRGMWIIELAELSNINKAEVEHIKAFITRTEERFRPPYGRNEIAFPRQCVFAGTTNRDDYLRDDTGNRRFWPVTVTDVDVEAIEEDRDQIWAEAVHHFRAGEQWHMSVDAIGLAHDEQAQRQADDPWADAIANFVNGRKNVSPSMVAVECLGIDIGRVNRADQNRIVSILRQMGWKKAGRVTTGKDYKGQFKYERGDA